METPEYIEGIPTEKKKSSERRSLIEHYYELLWKELQRENGTNGIFNPFLGVTVIIKKGESDKKTINRASADWKSTYAVKHLKQVITLACGKEDAPVYVEAKTGTQKKNGYKNMAILYHEFVHPELKYLNFMVKLTIGIKSDGKACTILCEQDRDTKQKTNRIQRLPYLKGTHTIGFLPAKLQLFHQPARGRMIFLLLPSLSSHVIPTLACAAAWDLWLRHLGICPC